RFMAVAVEDREPSDFPPPPEDLLAESEPAALSVSPPEVDPGATITVSGTGFGFCQASWSVAVEGTDLASPPEQDSDAEERSATIQLPDDIAPGEYRVVALCDSSAGPTEAASTAFT